MHIFLNGYILNGNNPNLTNNPNGNVKNWNFLYIKNFTNFFEKICYIFSAPLPHLSHLSNLHGSTPPLTLSPPPLYLQPEPYPGMHPDQHPGMHPDQHAGMHPEQYPVMHPDLQAGYSVPSPPGSNYVFFYLF